MYEELKRCIQGWVNEILAKKIARIIILQIGSWGGNTRRGEKRKWCKQSQITIRTDLLLKGEIHSEELRMIDMIGVTMKKKVENRKRKSKSSLENFKIMKKMKPNTSQGLVSVAQAGGWNSLENC